MLLIEKTWHTKLGIRVCQAITIGNHVFSGWNDSRHQGTYDEHGNYVLPYAYCERCGTDF